MSRLPAGAPNEMTAVAAVDAMRRGELTSEALVEACVARIEAREPVVHAWAYLDPENALAQARAADARREEGGALGLLHGVPVGIKDIFDTCDMPTECGSALYAGRRPARDAEAVARLRAAGAVILGKTVTAELALTAAGATTNPLDATRTPGGSSSGSAAAVADRMVPLAVGSQTGGSVIRPASFCGVHGYKPTFGAMPREGMHLLARRLDHVGVFARHLRDIALIADAMISGQPSGRPRSTGDLSEALSRPLADRPRIAAVKGPVWHRGAADARAAFEGYVEALPDVGFLELPEIFDTALACQTLICDANLAANLGAAYARAPGKLRERTRERIRNGLPVSASEYIHALETADAQGEAMSGIFADYDALLTLSAPGEAPPGLHSTGDHAFNAIWTLMGTPSITLPLLRGAHAMPIGVQVIAEHHKDAGLFSVAAWLERISASSY